MSDAFATLPGLHTTIWQRLGRGVADAKCPARRPTMATVSRDGWPEARTVVLRRADQSDGVIEVHTDLFSDKIKSLQQMPRAAFHIWEPKINLQIRLQTEVTIRSGGAVADIWAKVPDPARQSYGVTPPPGTPIPDALDYVKEPDAATFAVLVCTIMAIDVVHLGDQHRRAVFNRAAGWQGQWLSP